MTADGVSWWFRQRPFIWYSLHEHRLWLAILDTLGARTATTIDIRADEPVLAAVADALVATTGADLRLPPPEPEPEAKAAAHRDPRSRPGGRSSSGILARLRPPPTPAPREPTARDRHAERAAILDRRVELLERDAGRSVLVVSHPRVFQVIAGDADSRVVDPQLAPVTQRLQERGVPLVHVALDLDPRRDDVWPTIEADDRLLPDAYVRRRWATDGRPSRPRPPCSSASARPAGSRSMSTASTSPRRSSAGSRPSRVRGWPASFG